MMQKLNDLGLSEYEIKCYIALLQHGPNGGTQISKKSSVPQGKVYWALHKLNEKGFVNIVRVKPQLFSAVKPELAIKALAEDKVQQINTIKSLAIKEISEIAKPLREERVVEKIQVLSGKRPRYAINDHFFTSAKKEIRYIFTYDERPYSLMRVFKAALERGVKVRFIATSLDKAAKKYIREDLKLGVEIRYLNVQEIRLQIMDETEARITVINPKDRRDKTTIYFQHTGLAKHLADYFDVLWSKAKPIT